MRLTQVFNEIEDRHAGLSVALETAPVEQLALERGEEALAHGVVETIADRAPLFPDQRRLDALVAIAWNR